MDVTIQLVGLIALASGMLSVQFKGRKAILLAQLLASGLWVIHFGVLGAFTGAFLNGIGLLRTYSFHRWRNNRYASWVFWVVMSLVIVAGVITWNTSVSLLAIVGMVLSTVGLWQRNEQHIRWLLLAGAPVWFMYDLLVGSYAGMINEVIFASSIIIALVRYRHVRYQVKNTP